jgi:hypothetical protein
MSGNGNQFNCQIAALSTLTKVTQPRHGTIKLPADEECRRNTMVVAAMVDAARTSVGHPDAGRFHRLQFSTANSARPLGEEVIGYAATIRARSTARAA